LPDDQVTKILVQLSSEKIIETSAAVDASEPGGENDEDDQGTKQQLGEGDETYSNDLENEDLDDVDDDPDNENIKDGQQDKDDANNEIDVKSNPSGVKLTGSTSKKPASPLSLPKESSAGTFIIYFLVFVVTVATAYLVYHNRQKLLGLLVEGRQSVGRRRTKRGTYNKLSTKVDDVLPEPAYAESTKSYIY